MHVEGDINIFSPAVRPSYFSAGRRLMANKSFNRVLVVKKDEWGVPEEKNLKILHGSVFQSHRLGQQPHISLRES